MFRKKSRSAICFALWVILFAFTVGCSGGNSPINPDTQGDPNHPQEPVKSPREVLSAFADACIAQDIDAACAQLNNPRQWRSTLEFVKDMLPIAGKAIHEAEEIESGEDCVRYLIRAKFTVSCIIRI